MFGKKAAAAMAQKQGFLDIHTHILPGVDDGAQNLSDAMNLLRMAYEDGTRTVFLTPHYRGEFKEHSPHHLQEVFDDFSRVAQENFPDLKLYLGSEIYYEQDAPKGLLAGQILSLHNSRYCLLEFRAAALRSRIIAGVSAIRNSGYIPIISHAERYEIFRQDETLTDEVLSMGALIQLNAGSILDRRCWSVASFCRRLLKAQKVHFIATDAHDLLKRPPVLQRCFQKVARKYGQEYAETIFFTNPEAVAQNKEI